MDAIKSLDMLHRMAHAKLIADRTANKMFFTAQEFEENKGVIMLQTQLRATVQKEIEELSKQNKTLTDKLTTK